MVISKASVLSNTMSQQEATRMASANPNEISGRSSVSTLRNLAYAGPSSNQSSSNSLPNTVRHRTQAFTRGLTSLEPSQFLPNNASHSTTVNTTTSSLRPVAAAGSSYKAVSDPIVFLSLNKLMGKRGEDSSPLRTKTTATTGRSFKQQSVGGGVGSRYDKHNKK